MASRPVLIQLCKELDIEYEKLLNEEMVSALREEADRRFLGEEKVSADDLSPELRRFLKLEYDYIFKGKKGKELDWDYKL